MQKLETIKKNEIAVSQSFSELIVRLANVKSEIEKAIEHKELRKLIEIKTGLQAIQIITRNADGALLSSVEAKEVYTSSQRLLLSAERGAGIVIPVKFPQGGDRKSRSQVVTLKLEDYGLTKMDSTRMQRLAKIPLEKFEKLLTDSSKLTQNALVQEAKEIESKEKPPPRFEAKAVHVPKIFNRDFAECDLPDNSVDFGLTDPPWSVKLYPEAWDACIKQYSRILKPGAHLACYMGKAYCNDVYRILDSGGLEYEWTLCDLLTHGHARLSGYMVEWTPIAIYCKLPRNGGCQHHGDVVKMYEDDPLKLDLISDDKPVKDVHAWGQGVIAAEKMIREFSREGDLVLDGFLGGGSFCKAAIMQKRNFIGYEKDKQTYKILKSVFDKEYFQD